jgi:hypothetical protein
MKEHEPFNLEAEEALVGGVLFRRSIGERMLDSFGTAILLET